MFLFDIFCFTFMGIVCQGLLLDTVLILKGILHTNIILLL